MNSPIRVRPLAVAKPGRVTATLVTVVGALAIAPGVAGADVSRTGSRPTPVVTSAPATAPTPAPTPGSAPSPAPTPVPAPAATPTPAPRPELICTGTPYRCYNVAEIMENGQAVIDIISSEVTEGSENSSLQDAVNAGLAGAAAQQMSGEPAPLLDTWTSVNGGPEQFAGGYADDPSDTGDAGGSDPDGSMTQ